MIKVGDIIEIDNDQWAYVGKLFEIVEMTTYINSTSVKMILRDLSNPDRKLNATFPKQQIIKVSETSVQTEQYNLFAKVEIKPSRIKNAGIGVFALIKIEADSKVFEPKGPLQKIKLEDLSVLSPRQQHHLKKLAHVHPDQTFVIDCNIDECHAAYFINHSNNPNMIYCEKTYTWYAIKDIHIGEELTAYYYPHERDF